MVIRQVANGVLSTPHTGEVGRATEACLIWSGRLGMEVGIDGWAGGLLLGGLVRLFEEGEYMMVLALVGGQ